MNLSKELVEVLLAENIYKPENEQYVARDFNGFYENTSGLPALAIPGGDLGDLIALYSAAYAYGFEVDFDDAWKKLETLSKNTQIDEYSFKAAQKAEAWRHLLYVTENPERYDLDKEATTLLMGHFSRLGVQVPELEYKKMKHEEALVIVTGNVGVWPQFTISTPEGPKDIKLLIYHKTYADKRRKEYADLLFSEKEVKLYDGLDNEYLYEVLSETMDNHLYETINHIDSKLPIFSATYDRKGKLAVDQLR